MNEFPVQQGWQCPICKRIYSPFTIMCYYCSGESKTSTNVNSTGNIDWQKHQSITTASSTSISFPPELLSDDNHTEPPHLCAT